MKRPKSGLLTPTEAAKAKEPETGPGSATCFCRVMDRRGRAEDARLALRGRGGGQIVGQDVERFADILICDLEAVDDLHEAMRDMVQKGAIYRIRVAVVA